MIQLLRETNYFISTLSIIRQIVRIKKVQLPCLRDVWNYQFVQADLFLVESLYIVGLSIAAFMR